ncbi:hypothetical protein [Sulfitobacter sp. JL08]|uniref:hypothetical protein n=1 Tax=Sulfitobacter sp. JL08 TaxID=2070369 RepID=UPI0013B477AB|nr:hypothetical protein [Sulfitobacter sp. JL08]
MKRLLLSCALAAILPTIAMAQVVSLDEPNEQDPIDQGVEPLIRLNADDPSYDIWKKIREDISEGREPGPINIQRFTGGFPWQGMLTFFHLPVALTPEDLQAGQVEVAIFGAEMYNGMRVQSYGPMEMRAPMHVWIFI